MLNLKEQRYALIGIRRLVWRIPYYCLGPLVPIDETQRKVTNSGWNNEFERPIYFFEHRQGFACGWASLTGDQLILILIHCRGAVHRYTNIPPTSI